MTEYLTEKLPFDEMLKASKTGGSIWKAILQGGTQGDGSFVLTFDIYS